MLRTILWVIYFLIRLFLTIPPLFKLKYLLKKGKNNEAEILIDKVAKTWSTKLIKASGSTVVVKGEENVPENKAVVFVSNHLSNFDIIVLMGYIKKPKAFIAKKELSKFPVFSTWMRYLNCVFIERGNPRKALLSIIEGAHKLKQGHSMVIFPEGTRSMDARLKAFKPGSLKLAIKAGVPIVPVTLKGTNDIMPRDKFRIRPAEVEIIISPPVIVEENSDSNDLTEAVRNAIAKNLEQ